MTASAAAAMIKFIAEIVAANCEDLADNGQVLCANQLNNMPGSDAKQTVLFNLMPDAALKL